jgi:peptidoglycan/xylan/chitin deacetylase (PgdA/CDA1 family)
MDGVKPGSIVLLHDGDGYNPGGDRTQTADALPEIITGLRQRGYTFATLPAS